MKDVGNMDYFNEWQTFKFSPHVSFSSSCTSAFLSGWIEWYNISNALLNSLSSTGTLGWKFLDRCKGLCNTATGGLRMGITGPRPRVVAASDWDARVSRWDCVHIRALNPAGVLQTLMHKCMASLLASKHFCTLCCTAPIPQNKVRHCVKCKEISAMICATHEPIFCSQQNRLAYQMFNLRNCII